MAAYAHNFVVSILGPNGNIREVNNSGERIARLPYESEYKIRLKNKNSVRAKASVFVDGMDISPGRMFILNPGETCDIERFIQDGDLSKGNKFRFVNAAKGAATGELQDPYSDKLGFVEVHFYKEFVPVAGTWTTYTTNVIPGGVIGGINTFSGSGILRVGGAGGQSFTNCANTPVTPTANSFHISECATNSIATSLPADKGGTAMGAESNQQFTDYQGWFQTELLPVTLTIKLKGLKEQPVVEAVQHGCMSEMPPSEDLLDYLKWALDFISKDKNMLSRASKADQLALKKAKRLCSV